VRSQLGTPETTAQINAAAFTNAMMAAAIWTASRIFPFSNEI